MPRYSEGQLFSATQDVRVLRWPVEVQELEQLRRRGIPRLLVVENGDTPPVPSDSREDWIRAPVSRADFAARVAALRARAGTHRVPVLDQDGLLRYGSRMVPVSPTQTSLLQPLVERYGTLVPRHELIALLSAGRGTASQNALDLNIMRIRRKLAPLGLRIRTANARGYLLESGE
ncbi:helix-turn-helix domain-containing protein [Streptomyces humi]|uniref:helix-turn-helix domain-containing protein n=1 Tax=Streptomyces humi TaxID=1428620 RepID=UPI000D1BECE6|nr:helix-turn-helix domain-containing protein [Streptomyces humi]